MMRFGLQGRFVLAIVIVFVLYAATLAVAWRGQLEADAKLRAVSEAAMREQAQQALEERGRAVARLLADTLANPLYFLDLDTIGRVVATARAQPDIESVLVFDARGRIVHDGSGDIARFGQPMRDAFGPGAAAAQELRVQSDSQRIDVTLPIRIGGELQGGVRIGLSRESAARAVESAQQDLARQATALDAQRLRGLAVPVALLLLLAAGTAWLIARGLVRPIRGLARVAREMQAGRYEVAMSSDRSDEIGELIRSFRKLGEGLAAHDRDIRRLAYLDTLTGLPNRLMLREALARALMLGRSNGSGLALLFIDVDDFKRINDTLGHDAGDEALAQLARRLEQCLAKARDPEPRPDESSDLVARFGGDEFVAILGGSGLRERARHFAELAIAALREPLTAAGRTVHLNASVGITVFPEDAQDPQQLLKNGDIAMYQAKVHGKNCFRFFTNYMTRMAEDRLALEHDLRAAMSAGELELAYQPIVSLAQDRLAGAEALLRWNHPQRGLVPSTVFVRIAEDFGLIEALGHFALTRACADAAQWPAQADEPAPFVSVNLSVKQLRQPTLAEDVARVLRESGLPADRLHVELTESALLDDEPLALSGLSDLRRLGVRIWLDDFGTGFSGLSHLRRVPVDGVKIDRSFTQDLLTDRDDLALTSAIIAMARSLGIEAVAEGIESASQLEVLRGLGCDLGQGYWLGYPMTAAEMQATLRAAQGGRKARA